MNMPHPVSLIKQLIDASAGGHVEEVRRLLQDESVNPQLVCNLALFEACVHGHLTVVKILVEHGADLYAHDHQALRRAATFGHLPLAQYLVEQGGDVLAGDQDSILLALIHHHFPLADYLSQHEGHPTKENQRLIWLVGKGNENGVYYLIEHGGDLAVALETAQQFHQTALIQWLQQVHTARTEHHLLSTLAGPEPLSTTPHKRL